MSAFKTILADAATQQLERKSEFTVDETPCTVALENIPLKVFRKDARNIYKVVQVNPEVMDMTFVPDLSPVATAMAADDYSDLPSPQTVPCPGSVKSLHV
eukprot:1003784-Amphidinium_carterae.1